MEGHIMAIHDGNPSVPNSRLEDLSSATKAIHADDYLNKDGVADVAPAMHVSTTFRYPDSPEDLVPYEDLDVDTFEKHIYSRDTAPNSTRLEAILSSLLKANAITYSSGLAAYHAALVYLNPKRVSIGNAYHGCHGVISLHERLTGLKRLPLDCLDEDLQAGDVIHVETPMNPTGEAVSIAKYAAKAAARGAHLLVDATFGPPGLQDPFQWGADIVLHSGTKYLGGHSDMLCGVLAVRRRDWLRDLRRDRCYLGSVLGSFEGWLGVRSVRTLELRVQRQSQNAEKLVSWLHDLLHVNMGAVPDTGNANTDAEIDKNKDDAAVIQAVISRITHASLQCAASDDGADGHQSWLKQQMPNGYGPVFAIYMKSAALARCLPSSLSLFHHATSLGGVESLIEWRRMSDGTADPCLLRLSIGVEQWSDLRDDLLRGFHRIFHQSTRKTSP